MQHQEEQQQQQQQQPGLEGIVMKPSEPAEDEQEQEQEAKPRRIYQAWKGNNVSFHLLL
jgi:palmitoyltransferase ZDHHC9/14/18